LGERRVRNAEVVGSIPIRSTMGEKMKHSLQTGILTLFLLPLVIQSSGYGIESRNSNQTVARTRRQISSYNNPEPILNPSAEALTKSEEADAPFNPYLLPYSIGYEGPTLPLGGSGTNPSVLSSPAVSFGAWVNKTMGYEVYLGHSKTSGSSFVQTATATNEIAKTKSVTTSYGGADQPRTFIFGGAFKYRLYQYKHFGLSTDFLFSFTPGFGVNYNSSGTKTTSTPNTDAPENYTVTESNVTNIEDKTSALLRLGPRFNIEYNFPYLPNLLIGFSSGIFVGFGGNNTQTTTVYNKTTAYTNGEAGTPTTDNSTTTVKETSPGGSSTTYAIGGTGLNITGSGLIPISVVGTFRIRYAF